MKLIECPRDAMQGLHDFIPTELKIKYINSLLSVGFDTLDVGSFVSPKAIPQMKDTKEVLDGLGESGATRLSVIVANERGINEAVSIERVDDLGYPLSLSETFQQRNTNRSITDAFEIVKKAVDACGKFDKRLNVYLSMGFGNPYGDDYSVQFVSDFAGRLAALGVPVISLSDTIGVADPASIEPLFSKLVSDFAEIEFGAHLHSHVNTVNAKLKSVLDSGCHRVDGAIRGFGGCPMAKDDLVGNMPTELIVNFLEKHAMSTIDRQSFDRAMKLSNEVFLD